MKQASENIGNNQAEVTNRIRANQEKLLRSSRDSSTSLFAEPERLVR